MLHIVTPDADLFSDLTQILTVSHNWGQDHSERSPTPLYIQHHQENQGPYFERSCKISVLKDKKMLLEFRLNIHQLIKTAASGNTGQS